MIDDASVAGPSSGMVEVSAADASSGAGSGVASVACMSVAGPLASRERASLALLASWRKPA